MRHEISLIRSIKIIKISGLKQKEDIPVRLKSFTLKLQ